MSPRQDSRRVNIADIARQAQVSTATVSYALNGLPGVSQENRRRIVEIADRMGWRPNSSARALHRARTDAVGMVLIKSGVEPGQMPEFLLHFLPGIQDELAGHGILLILHTVPDQDVANETYRQWRDEKRVDGVIVLNPLTRDPRLTCLEELGLPAVVVGDTRRVSVLPSVWTDDAEAMALAVDHLVRLGHQRIGRVGFGPDFLHSRARERAFRQCLRKAGLEPDLNTYHRFGPPREQTFVQWLRSEDPPTALIHEDPTFAIQTMLAMEGLGIAVPGDLSIVCWDDSQLSDVVRPTVTRLHRDLFEYGKLVARQLVAQVNGEPCDHVRGTTTELLVRGSTGSAPSASGE